MFYLNQNVLISSYLAPGCTRTAQEWKTISTIFQKVFNLLKVKQKYSEFKNTLFCSSAQLGSWQKYSFCHSQNLLSEERKC